MHILSILQLVPVSHSDLSDTVTVTILFPWQPSLSLWLSDYQCITISYKNVSKQVKINTHMHAPHTHTHTPVCPGLTALSATCFGCSPFSIPSIDTARLAFAEHTACFAYVTFFMARPSGTREDTQECRAPLIFAAVWSSLKELCWSLFQRDKSKPSDKVYYLVARHSIKTYAEAKIKEFVNTLTKCILQGKIYCAGIKLHTVWHLWIISFSYFNNSTNKPVWE